MQRIDSVAAKGNNMHDTVYDWWWCQRCHCLSPFDTDSLYDSWWCQWCNRLPSYRLFIRSVFLWILKRSRLFHSRFSSIAPKKPEANSGSRGDAATSREPVIKKRKLADSRDPRPVPDSDGENRWKQMASRMAVMAVRLKRAATKPFSFAICEMLCGCFSFYCWSCFACEILVLWHEIAICKSSIWGIQLTYCVCCHTSDLLWLLPVQILDSKSSVSSLRWWDSVERPNRRGSNCQIEGPLSRSKWGVRRSPCDLWNFHYFHLKGTWIWQIWHSICMLMPDLCQIYFFVAACCSDLGGRSDVGFSQIRQPGLSLPNRAAMVWGKKSWLDIWRLGQRAFWSGTQKHENT